MFDGFWWVCDRTTVTKKCRFQSSFEATSRKYVADTCNEFPALQFELLYCDGPLSTLSPCIFFVCPESLSQRVRVSRRFTFMEVLEPDPMSIKQRTHFVHGHKSADPPPLVLLLIDIIFDQDIDINNVLKTFEQVSYFTIQLPRFRIWTMLCSWVTCWRNIPNRKTVTSGLLSLPVDTIATRKYERHPVMSQLKLGGACLEN